MKYSTLSLLAAVLALPAALLFSSGSANAKAAPGAHSFGEVYCSIGTVYEYSVEVRRRILINGHEIYQQTYVLFDEGFGLDKPIALFDSECRGITLELCNKPNLATSQLIRNQNLIQYLNGLNLSTNPYSVTCRR